MQVDEVPQDNSSTYKGEKKLLYAVSADGRYDAVTSTGWEVEEFVTSMAVAELEQLAEDARQRVLAGESSPIEYYMYAKRLDEPALALATGLFRWRVRRHMKPAVFARLGDKLLLRYCDAFGIDLPTLKNGLS